MIFDAINENLPERLEYYGCESRKISADEYWDDRAVHMPKPPYRPGDILYVRETWRVQSAHRFEADARIEFNAGGGMGIDLESAIALKMKYNEGRPFKHGKMF